MHVTVEWNCHRQKSRHCTDRYWSRINAMSRSILIKCLRGRSCRACRVRLSTNRSSWQSHAQESHPAGATHGRASQNTAYERLFLGERQVLNDDGTFVRAQLKSNPIIAFNYIASGKCKFELLELSSGTKFFIQPDLVPVVLVD